MRRSRSFSPSLDSLYARIVPSTLLSYMIAVGDPMSPPVTTTTTTYSPSTPPNTNIPPYTVIGSAILPLQYPTPAECLAGATS